MFSVTHLTIAVAGVMMTLSPSSLAYEQLQQHQQQQQQQQHQEQQHQEQQHHLNTYGHDERVEQPEYLNEEDGQYREELYSNTNSIPGVPGTDYPTLSSIPKTPFSCTDKLPGFYADEDANCQVWHYCKTDGLMESFLCPNGTIYNQANRVCEWWFNVQCEDTTASYRVNEDLYIVPVPSSTEAPDVAYLNSDPLEHDYYDGEEPYQQQQQGYYRE